jgi:hypothetical protein
MSTETHDYPRWLERLVAIVIATFIALYLLAPAAYPQQFRARTETKVSPTTTANPPGYLGISRRTCVVERVTDNQGNLNGFRLRVQLSYVVPDLPEWERVMGMYRLEDERQAHIDCLEWQKQIFKKIWDAKKKVRKARSVENQPQKPALPLSARDGSSSPAKSEHR